MKISEQNDFEVPMISEIQNHSVTVHDQRVETSFFLGTETPITDWSIRSSKIELQAIHGLPLDRYELLLIGTGLKFCSLANDVISALSGKVQFEVMTTISACRTFNIVAGEGRKVLVAGVLGESVVTKS